MHTPTPPQSGHTYRLPFILITTLFFLWGFAHSILDVLDKHFQDTLSLSVTSSALIQAVVYGGYFLMAIPAGHIITRHGYKTGVITGLILYATGALLFIPGAHLHSFPFFLLCLFIIGCGLPCLETAANPYVTVLGPADTAPQRINLAQSLNGLGWILGPLVGGLLLFSPSPDPSPTAIAIPYAIIGTLVLLIALIFRRTTLPEITTTDPSTPSAATHSNLWRHTHFTLGLIALFLYVAAQTGLNSLFINYATSTTTLTPRQASLILSFGCMGLFMFGRMTGSWAMNRIQPHRLLLLAALLATLTMLLILLAPTPLGIPSLLLCYLCESIMFPTIFALAISHLGHHTKRASSYLIMSIVGGAIAPILMGHIADTTASLRTPFIVPMTSFLFIAIYAFWLQKHPNSHKNAPQP